MSLDDYYSALGGLDLRPRYRIEDWGGRHIRRYVYRADADIGDPHQYDWHEDWVVPDSQRYVICKFHQALGRRKIPEWKPLEEHGPAHIGYPSREAAEAAMAKL